MTNANDNAFRRCSRQPRPARLPSRSQLRAPCADSCLLFALRPRRRIRDAAAAAANGEMHTARFGFLSKTEAAVRRIGPLRRTEALLAFAPLN